VVLSKQTQTAGDKRWFLMGRGLNYVPSQVFDLSHIHMTVIFDRLYLLSTSSNVSPVLGGKFNRDSRRLRRPV